MPSTPTALPFTPGVGFDAQAGFHDTIRGHLPSAGAVLDLGCGDHTELAPYRTRDREVWGADLQEHLELRHREWFRTIPPEGRLPFPDSRFDLVTAAWVLEHIRHPVAFFAEVGRVLRPGGHFVALTPHACHYATWIIRATSLLPHWVTQAIVAHAYGRVHHDTFPTFYRLNSRRRVATAATAGGLEPTQWVAYANPDYFRFFRVTRRAAIMTDLLLDRAWFGLGRLYLVAILRKPVAVAAVVRAAA